MGKIYLTPEQTKRIQEQAMRGAYLPQSHLVQTALHSLSPVDRARQELILAQRNTHHSHRIY